MPDVLRPHDAVVILTLDQLDRIGELGDQWSFLWDKRRSLWIAAEDCPDGEQFEEADLDVLLARLPAVITEGREPGTLVRQPDVQEVLGC